MMITLDEEIIAPEVSNIRIPLRLDPTERSWLLDVLQLGKFSCHGMGWGYEIGGLSKNKKGVIHPTQ